MKISKYYFLAVGIIFLQVLFLIYFGQPLISKTGHIYLYWFGGGVEDSQQIFDWYSFSHIIHGVLFYFLLTSIFRKLHVSITDVTENKKLLIAVLIEACWELLENSPIIINRYRQIAIAAGYFGDSVLNSFFDVVWMISGFYFAKKFGWKASLIMAIFFELLTLYFIKDNLTLNILMLLHPFNSVSLWQLG